MGRIEETFARLRSTHTAAFMPYITAGDPSLLATKDLLTKLEQAGADLVELGIPFSDPIADGPVIQASHHRALSAGCRVDKVFQMMREVREGALNLPVVAMVSYSIVFRRGTDRWAKEAAEAGFDGLIVPDLPIDEAEEFASVARENGLRAVQLVTPATPDERAQRIAEASQGFIYYVSVKGTTGARDELPDDMVENIKRLKSWTETPVCLGFGVSTPAQAAAVAKVADGVIVGSALVRLIAEGGGPDESSLGAVVALAKELAEAVHGMQRTCHAKDHIGEEGKRGNA